MIATFIVAPFYSVVRYTLSQLVMTNMLFFLYGCTIFSGTCTMFLGNSILIFIPIFIITIQVSVSCAEVTVMQLHKMT